MTPGSIARRYARALYDLALAEGNVDQVGEFLAAVAEAISSAEDEVKKGALATESRKKMGTALASPFGLDSTFGKFVQLVALRDRLGEMPGVDHWFVRFQDEAAGRVRLQVSAPEPLSVEASDSIVRTFSKVAGKEIMAEAAVDPSLLGGAVVELEGRVFDGSVKTKLARMAARMAGDA